MLAVDQFSGPTHVWEPVVINAASWVLELDHECSPLDLSMCGSLWS